MPDFRPQQVCCVIARWGEPEPTDPGPTSEGDRWPRTPRFRPEWRV